MPESPYMEIITSIGNAIRERRKLLGINQRTLAELSEVGVNVVTRIERGESNTSIKVLEKVLETLGMELTATVKNVK